MGALLPALAWASPCRPSGPSAPPQEGLSTPAVAPDGVAATLVLQGVLVGALRFSGSVVGEEES